MGLCRYAGRLGLSEHSPSAAFLASLSVFVQILSEYSHKDKYSYTGTCVPNGYSHGLS